MCYMRQVTVVPNGPTADQKTAANVGSLYDSLIGAKPDTLTEEFCMQVKELENNYEALTRYQKNLLGSEKVRSDRSLASQR